MSTIQCKIPFILFVLFASLVNLSSSGGLNGNQAGAPFEGTCGGCHFDAGNGSISLSGLPFSFLENQTYTFTLTLEEDFLDTNPSAVGGFQIVAIDIDSGNNNMVGSFTPSTGTRVTPSGRLTHSTPASMTNGEVSWTFDYTAPSHGVGPIRFYYTGNAANGNGVNGAGDYAHNSSSANISLPVDFYALGSRQVEEGVELSWITAFEINASHFEVEWHNGLEWERLASVEAVGDSREKVDYSTIVPVKQGGSHQFRIRQVDLDGQYMYSEIIKTYIDRASLVTVYPNPVQDLLKIKSEGPVKVFVHDQFGKLAFTGKQNFVNMEGWANGIYMLTIFDEVTGQSTSHKIVKI